jgi:hypothetical protein
LRRDTVALFLLLRGDLRVENGAPLWLLHHEYTGWHTPTSVPMLGRAVSMCFFCAPVAEELC